MAVDGITNGVEKLEVKSFLDGSKPKLSPEELKEKMAHFKEHGWVAIPEVLTKEQTKTLVDRLWRAREESEKNGDKTYLDWLDPNEFNVRIFYLMALDPIFIELVQHPIAIQMVKAILGGNFQLSNFTANISLPGSKSMGLHSDTSLQCPDPWIDTWGCNTMWALSELYGEGGATLYIPNSHHWKTKADIPEDAEKLLVPLQAPAGSMLVMDGRLWHTSGVNTSKDFQRPLLFGAWNAPFLRSQVNWAVALSEETKKNLSDDMKNWLGVNRDGNLGVVEGVNEVF